MIDNSYVSIHDHFNTFHQKTTECINNHIPKKKVSKKDPNLRSKPWINNETQRRMNYGDKLFNNMIKNPSPLNKYIYRKFRNHVVYEQRRGKINYFQRYFETHKTNMRMLWSSIRSIVNVSTKKQLTQISHSLENGNRTDDPTKMVNIFDNYLVNVASNIDKSIPGTQKSPTDYLKNRNADSTFLSPVTEQEIEFIICNR